MTTRIAGALIVSLAAVLGCSSSSTEPNPPGIDVSIQPNAAGRGSSAFAPSPFTVSLAAGGTVKWRNGGCHGDYLPLRQWPHRREHQ